MNPKIRDITYIPGWFKYPLYLGEACWSIHEGKLVSIYEKEFQGGVSLKAAEGWAKPKSGDVRIYWKGFENFLAEKQWKKIWKTRA